MEDVPRRVHIDKFVPAERAIYDAVQAVEAMAADTRLTEAVILLQRARDKVADFVDGVESEPWADATILAAIGEEMKRAKDLLEKLTVAFPPHKPACHSINLSDEGLLLVSLACDDKFYTYALDDEDCEKKISVLVEEISAMHSVAVSLAKI